tara:strand:+ start:3450 stop:3710 length:261 start_codon:yes stop_codon:yes gene_type:complete
MAVFINAGAMKALTKKCIGEIAAQEKCNMWAAITKAARKGEDYLTNITYAVEISPKLEKELVELGFEVEIKGVYSCVQRWHISWRD